MYIFLRTPPNSYISYFGDKTLLSPNLIIIMGTFRNTSNYIQITIFHTGSSAYYQMFFSFTLTLSNNYADDAWTSNA